MSAAVISVREILSRNTYSSRWVSTIAVATSIPFTRVLVMLVFGHRDDDLTFSQLVLGCSWHLTRYRVAEQRIQGGLWELCREQEKKV